METQPLITDTSNERYENRTNNRNNQLEDKRINTAPEARYKIPDDTIKKAKKLAVSMGKEIFISYWDLGGDELYYATHHIHFTSDAMYLLVFDLSKMEMETKKTTVLGK